MRRCPIHGARVENSNVVQTWAVLLVDPQLHVADVVTPDDHVRHAGVTQNRSVAVRGQCWLYGLANGMNGPPVVFKERAEGRADLVNHQLVDVAKTTSGTRTPGTGDCDLRPPTCLYILNVMKPEASVKAAIETEFPRSQSRPPLLCAMKYWTPVSFAEMANGWCQTTSAPSCTSWSAPIRRVATASPQRRSRPAGTASSAAHRSSTARCSGRHVRRAAMIHAAMHECPVSSHADRSPLANSWSIRFACAGGDGQQCPERPRQC